jgi:hypothetical protein
VFKRVRITTLLAMVIFCVLVTIAYLPRLLSSLGEQPEHFDICADLC